MHDYLMEPAEVNKVFIIRTPPIPKKNHLKYWLPGIHSLLPFPLVPVISSTKFIVSNPSVNPTRAWWNYFQGFELKVISGIWKEKTTAYGAISATVFVSILTLKPIKTILMSGGFGHFRKKDYDCNVKATKPSITNMDYNQTLSIYDCFELLQLRHKIL
jgi:hypothetical protein